MYPGKHSEVISTAINRLLGAISNTSNTSAYPALQSWQYNVTHAVNELIDTVIVSQMEGTLTGTAPWALLYKDMKGRDLRLPDLEMIVEQSDYKDAHFYNFSNVIGYAVKYRGLTEKHPTFELGTCLATFQEGSTLKITSENNDMSVVVNYINNIDKAMALSPLFAESVPFGLSRKYRDEIMASLLELVVDDDTYQYVDSKDDFIMDHFYGEGKEKLPEDHALSIIIKLTGEYQPAYLVSWKDYVLVFKVSECWGRPGHHLALRLESVNHPVMPEDGTNEVKLGSKIHGQEKNMLLIADVIADIDTILADILAKAKARE